MEQQHTAEQHTAADCGGGGGGQVVELVAEVLVVAVAHGTVATGPPIPGTQRARSNFGHAFFSKERNVLDVGMGIDQKT